MDCPVCGKANPLQSRLCGHCATPLLNMCDRCHFENPPGFRFCGNCGFRIGETVPVAEPRQLKEQGTTGHITKRLRSMMPEAFAEKIAAERGREGSERREVTVLFMDLQGFTSFSERNDPEAVFERLGYYLSSFIEVIYAYEGSVDKFTGDGLMALFGVPVAHENDPERACRAALDMQRLLNTINEQLQDKSASGNELSMRIGINTGQVIAGSIGPDLRMEYTVVGDTVNVSKRLETAAQPGSILIGESTYHRVAELFEGEDKGTLELRGRQEPVHCYQLKGLHALPASHGRGRVRLPMIGRAEELNTLEETVRKSYRGMEQVILITGEAGIGKSRLLRAWQRRTALQETRVLYGASLSYRQPISYWPFITLLQNLFDIREEDSDELRWQKLENGAQELASELAPGELLPFIAHFLGLPIPDEEMAWQLQQLAPAQLRQQSYIALRVLLVTLAYQQPLVLILEDLHWADSSTLDLLSFLMGKSSKVPLTFILVTRPLEGPASERLSKMSSEVKAELTRLALAPLDEQEMELLIEAWLSPAEGEQEASGKSLTPLPAPFREYLLAQAEGNPFFLEELLEMWAAQEYLIYQHGQWELRPNLTIEESAIPPSLNALLTARLDRLPEDAHRTLQLASVIGRTFPLNLLQHLARQQIRPLPLAELLEFLEAERLIEREGPDGGSSRWRFRHPLVRDTLYQEMLRSERRDLHEVVGGSLELLFRERVSPKTGGWSGAQTQQVELIAHHYEQAEEWERALPFLRIAAEHAAARFDNETALLYAKRCLRLVEKTFVSWDTCRHLHELMGEVYLADNQFNTAEQHFRIAMETLDEAQIEDARRTAELFRKLARLNERRGDYEEALRWLNRAQSELEQDEKAQGSVELARVLNDTGWVLLRQGDLPRAQALAYESLRLLEGTEYLQDIASAYNRLVATYMVQGNWQQAEAFALKGLKLRESIGFQPGIASSCQTMATLLTYLGRWDEALQYAARMLGLGHSTSSRSTECEALILQATLYLYKGALDRALSRAETARARADELALLPLRLQAYRTLAHVHQARGELREAHLLVLRAIECAHLLGEREAEATTHTDHAAILLARGKVREGQSEARQALRLATELSIPMVVAGARRVLGACHLSLNDLAGAENHLNKAALIYGQMNLPYELARSTLLLARLRMSQNNAKDARVLCKQAARAFCVLGAVAEFKYARALVKKWVAQPPQGVVASTL